MLFKPRFLLLLLALGLCLPQTLLAVTSIANEIQTRPFGVIIRKNFVERFADYLNQRAARNEPIHFEECVDNQVYQGDLFLSLDKPRWTPQGNGGPQKIAISTKIRELRFQGRIQEGCDQPDGSSQYYKITLHDFPIEFFVDAKSLNVTFNKLYLRIPEIQDPSSEGMDDHAFLKLPPEHIKIEVGPARQPLSVVNRVLANATMNALAQYAEKKIQDWIMQSLKGLYFVESLEDMLGESSFWTEGVEIKKGAISLTNEGASPQQRRISFAIFADPGEQKGLNYNRIFARNDSLDIFLNSAFLDPQDLSRLSLKGPEFSLQDQFRALVGRLQNGEIRAKSYLGQPDLPTSDTDLSLVVANELFTDALRAIYLQGMLKFRTAIDLGLKTQDLLLENAPNIETIIQLSPHAAPELEFNANRLRLLVKDYSLEIGTMIEDRIIPSENILANVSFTNELVIDSERETLNLSVLPESFQVSIESQFKSLGKAEIDILQNLTKEIWTDFFNTYPDLVLFPTLISTDQAPLKIESISVNPKYTVLHMNIVWNKDEGGSP